MFITNHIKHDQLKMIINYFTLRPSGYTCVLKKIKLVYCQICNVLAAKLPKPRMDIINRRMKGDGGRRADKRGIYDVSADALYHFSVESVNSSMYKAHTYYINEASCNILIIDTRSVG